MNGWIVRWRPPYARPEWPLLESSIYASQEIAMDLFRPLPRLLTEPCPVGRLPAIRVQFLRNTKGEVDMGGPGMNLSEMRRRLKDATDALSEARSHCDIATTGLIQASEEYQRAAQHLTAELWTRYKP